MSTTVAINFTGGDFDSSHTDGNKFWLTVGSYVYTSDILTNSTSFDVTSLTLNNNYAGMFSNYTLNVYLRVEFYLNGVLTYKYLFGDSNGASIGQKSMPGTTLSLLTTSQMVPVVIPHNNDGSRPDVVLRGYCDSATNATYVPEGTLANSSVFSFPSNPRGPRIKDGGTWKQTVLYIKDGGTWKLAVPYIKDGGTWKIGGG